MSSIAPIPPTVTNYRREVPHLVAQFYAVGIVTYVFAVVAVLLRFWARRLMKAQIWVDDWIVAVALV